MTAIDLFAGLGGFSQLKRTCAMKRFVEKVALDGECWSWTAGLMGGGYGQFHYRGRPHYAHRWLYERTKGPIPDGLTLDHLCRNRRCVNPAHLEPVTRGENVLRGESPVARAARATHCPHGHPYAGSNLVIKSDGTRRCRECHRQSARRRYARRRAECKRQ